MLDIIKKLKGSRFKEVKEMTPEEKKEAAKKAAKARARELFKKEHTNKDK